MTRSRAALSWPEGLRYGALGAPLAFVALPLYVQWPAFAAPSMGLSLTTLGLMLLAVRCLDAAIDPWLGQRADLWLARSRSLTMRVMLMASVALMVGFGALFLAPDLLQLQPTGWIAWSVGALALTYLAYSTLQILHQAWGARLGGDAAERARVVGAREACALAGVVVASVAPGVVGWSVTAMLLAILLVVGLMLLTRAPSAVATDGDRSRTGLTASPSMGAAHAQTSASDGTSLWAPWRHAEFRALMGVFVLNGLASAVPATLVLFYVRDQLQLPAYEGAFLGFYFLAAAASVPLWTRVVAAWGLVRAWASGMVLAMLVFIVAGWLGPGDGLAFAMVCAGSGVALGADLVAPAALLAGALQRAGLSQRGEGLWFGWWNLASKLNLALAAGLALPLVQALGYQSGSRDETSLQALVWVYALVPCAIKALGLAALLMQRWQEPPLAQVGNMREEVRP